MTDNLHFFFNDLFYPIQRNDLVLLDSSDIHGFIFSGNIRLDRYVIEFDPEYVRDMCEYCDILHDFCKLDKEPIIHLSEAQTATFIRQFDKLYSYEEKPDIYGYKLYQKLAFSELLLLIGNYVRDLSPTEAVQEDPRLNRLQIILSYIKDHLSEPLTLKKLAGQVYLSPSYFGMIFKSYTGYSVNQYIINQRVVRATALLKKGATVQEAAEQSGFNDYAHFIRTFKKYTGMPPKQFINNQMRRG